MYFRNTTVHLRIGREQQLTTRPLFESGAEIDYPPTAIPQEVRVRLGLLGEDQKRRGGPRHDMVLTRKGPQ